MKTKETLLRLLWLDDDRLIHKSRFMGSVYIWISIVLILFLICAYIFVHHLIEDFKPVINEMISNVYEDEASAAESRSLKACLSMLSTVPELLQRLYLCITALGFAAAFMGIGTGIYLIRYHQVFAKTNPKDVNLTR